MPYIDPVTGAYVADSLNALPPGYNQPSASDAANIAKMRAAITNQATQTPAPSSTPSFIQPIQAVMQNMPGAPVGQAAISMGSDMLGGLLGNLYGAYKGITGGEYGKSTDIAQQNAALAAQNLHYTPPTQQGQNLVSAINKLPEQITGSSMGIGPLPELMGMNARFTPDDLRAGATSAITDVRNFPMDYANAKMGLQREYPTLGSRAAGATDTATAMAKPLAEMAYNQIMETGNIKMPGGLPDIPVYNYAVKPKGGEFATTLGAPLEQSGVIGKYLTEKNALTPVNFFNKLVDPLDLTPTQKHDLTRAIEQILEKHGGSPTYNQDVLNSIKELSNIHNKVFPEKTIPLPNNIDNLVKAKNEWTTKNLKNYIEKEMGSGLPSDSVLATIEKYNRSIYEPDQYSSMFGSELERADYIRKEALSDYQFANEQFDKYENLLKNQKWAKYDLNSPQFENVGKQTAKTEAGKTYENMTDYALERMLNFEKKEYPYGEKLPNNTVVRDLRTGYTGELGFNDILNHIEDKLISGEYKPENLKNKSVSAVVSDIFENRIAKEKEIGKDKEAYNNWVKNQHDSNLPIDSPMLGTTPTVFPDGSKIALFDATYAKDNPDMFIRQLSVDTKDLDHCVAHCGHNKANNYRRYAPAVEPHTGIMPTGGDKEIGMNYPNSVERGSSIIGSLRDPNGHAQATMEFNPSFSGSDYEKFRVQQIMGLEDDAVNPKYQPYVKSWLNQYPDRIDFVNEDHGLKNISSFDLKQMGNSNRDFIRDIHNDTPLFPKGMLDRLVNQVINKENVLNPGLKESFQAGYVDPFGIFSKYLPRFFDSSDLLNLADRMGIDIMEHPVTMSKPHIQNAGDIIGQLENHRNLAEKIGDISASDQFTKLIQKVTNRINEAEQ